MATTISTSNSSSKDVTLLQHVAQQKNKILEEITKKHESEIKKQEKAISELNNNIVLTTQERAKAQLKAEKGLLEACEHLLEEYTKERKKAEDDLAEYKKKLETESLEILEIYQKNYYKNASNRKKKEFQEQKAEELKQKKKSLEEQYAMQDAQHKRLNKIINSKTASDSEKEAAKVERTQIIKDKAQTRKALRNVSDAQSAAETAANNLFQIVATAAEKAQKATENYTKAEKNRAEVIAEEHVNQENLRKKLKAAKTKDEKEAIQNEMKASKARVDRVNEEAQAALDAKEAAKKAAEKEKTLEQEKEEREKRRSNNIAKLANAASNVIDSALNNLYSEQGRMEGRLQGSNTSWKAALDVISTNIGFSGIASQQKVVEKMVQLVDSGVAYNLELRAFLAETSENIASTFNAFDSNLLRLIRLQQSDSTAARLGMEAALTTLFNDYFEDSSYLAEEVSDSVSSAILDASATMSRNDSLQFEYVVQKWLGSLYSLGMSSQAVTTIAEGINYLATGNVTALSGNSSLQTLLSMSASKTKKSYADMLIGGLSASETNDLLKSMIEILSSIASNTDNRVTSAAYAELFNMSLTDLRTFSSLTAEEISNIYASTVDYGGLIQTTESQLTQIMNRKNLAQIVDTVIENAMTGAAQNIGSNVPSYALWKALNLTDSLVNLEIPGITVVGSGTTSAIDILNIAKLGFAGQNLLTSLIEALPSGLRGQTSLTAWNFAESTTRGATLPVLEIGPAGNTSYSAKLGIGGGGSDISDVSFETAQETARENAGISSEELQKSQETPQKILDAVAGDSTPTVLSLLQEIDDRLDLGRVFYTAIIGQATSSAAVSQINNLSTSIATAQATAAGEDSSSSASTQGSASTSSSTSSSSNVSNATEEQDMQSLIAAAVEQALRNMVGYSLPVTVTNLPVGGVM